MDGSKRPVCEDTLPGNALRGGSSRTVPVALEGNPTVSVYDKRPGCLWDGSRELYDAKCLRPRHGRAPEKRGSSPYSRRKHLRNGRSLLHVCGVYSVHTGLSRRHGTLRTTCSRALRVPYTGGKDRRRSAALSEECRRPDNVLWRTRGRNRTFCTQVLEGFRTADTHQQPVFGPYDPYSRLVRTLWFPSKIFYASHTSRPTGVAWLTSWDGLG
jgi:hypothetical protein